VIKISITGLITDLVAWEERDFAGLRIVESPTILPTFPYFPVFSSPTATLEVVGNTGNASSEKAGVGGSSPSLATIFSITWAKLLNLIGIIKVECGPVVWEYSPHLHVEFGCWLYRSKRKVALSATLR
jgi:hypothetical protein